MKTIQAKAVRVANLRTIAILGLLVVAMLFAPLGQGVGLSAGQGPLPATDPGVAANALAAQEVERLVGLD